MNNGKELLYPILSAPRPHNSVELLIELIRILKSCGNTVSNITLGVVSTR